MTRYALLLSLLTLAAACGQSRPLNRQEAVIEVPAELDFGEVATHTTRTEPLLVRNVGARELVVEDVRVTGDDAFEISTGSQTNVVAGGTAIWEVSFSPETLGEQDGSVLIQSNHEDGGLVEVTLVGVAIQGCDDGDGDGYGPDCPLGDDCDDSDAAINPGTTWYMDFDGDTYGDASQTLVQCAQPTNYVLDNRDCDDSDPTVAPFRTWYLDDDTDLLGDPMVSVEACEQPTGYVANDDDCDDSNITVGQPVLWYFDNDDDFYGDPDVTVQQCVAPPDYVANGDDCDDSDDTRFPGAVWYRDFDGDLYGDPNVAVIACEPPLNHVGNSDDCDDTDPRKRPGAIWYLDNDGDNFGNPAVSEVGCLPPAGYVADNTDCDDDDANEYPGAIWYQDFDGDTYGNPAVTLVACEQPTGYVANNGDCDDTNALVVPTTLWYRDFDGDTFGDPNTFVLACTQPSGYVADNTDCDDTDANAYPGATWYRDFDGDGYGNPDISIVDCQPGAGWVSNDLDCDDTDGDIQAFVTWYQDLDTDTYGNPNVSQEGCTQPAGYVDNNLDCDDTNPNVNPDADESGATLCNDGLDNDCDGEPDSFDSACTYVDCGEPAYYLSTGQCNAEFPSDEPPQICEEYPNSPWPEGQREQCMQVCRTRAECPAGFACYPSRRSLNLHFCAPAIGAALVATGDACSVDEDCQSALCHENVCREVCVRDQDCGPGDVICRGVVRIHAYIGNEISTGVCVPRNTMLLPLGANCASGATCQSGVCAQSSATGPYICRRSCGAQIECGPNQRCSPSIYNNNPAIGYGYAACSEAPVSGFTTMGNFCQNDQSCRSFFCDSTYCPDPFNMNTCIMDWYCNGLCNTDADCPLLLQPSYGLNLQMRCLVTSSTVIQPLIGGYCVPVWCYTNADCASGSCLEVNPDGALGMPPGLCQY